jgi:hypothetical protein
MSKVILSVSERMAVDALKSDARIFLNCGGERQGGKTFLAAVAVSEMADEMGGIHVTDARTGISYFVPPGTPWQESLPV